MAHSETIHLGDSHPKLTFAFQARLPLTTLRSRVILGSLDILVDIGVPAEKEVIQ
jgi:hypothetical protein